MRGVRKLRKTAMLVVVVIGCFNLRTRKAAVLHNVENKPAQADGHTIFAGWFHKVTAENYLYLRLNTIHQVCFLRHIFHSP